jgi:outer membrane lipoprotein LolB
MPRSRLLAIVAVAVIAGCRTVPVQQPPVSVGQSWETTRSELQARDHYALKGRVAVAAGKDGFNAGLRWKQDGTLSQVSLEGPLGAGAVQISADGNNLSIVNSHGDHLDSEAAHAELAARLGFDPPLSSLRYWILGVPDPTMPFNEVLDLQKQRLQSLEQGGWQIDYTGYMPGGVGSGAAAAGASGVSGGAAGSAGAAAVATAWLPAKMTVQRSGVRVRLIVDGWGS